MKKIFFLYGFWLFSLLFVGIILAISGIFWKSLILFSGVVFLFFSIFRFGKFFPRETFNDRGVWIVLTFFLAWSALSFHYSESTVFSGRDQGSFSEAAVRLVQNGGLEFSFPAEEEFFRVYGEGRAYNFPGFSYTDGGSLKTQFSLGYVTYLGEFYSWFGLSGLKLANLAAILVFILSFYFLSQKILQKSALFPPLFALTSFVFLWFSKFTLGENLALALLWFAILNLAEFWQVEKKIHFFLASLGLLLLVFVRIEALAILAMAVLMFFLRYGKFEEIRKKIGTLNLAFWFLGGAVLLAGFSANIEFYILAAKGFLGGLPGTSGAEKGILGEIIHTFNVLSVYSLLIFLAFSILGVSILFQRKDWSRLLPFFLVLPTVFFLLDPGISDDHPWMLRRFLYSLIPAFFLYSAVFLETFLKKRLLVWIFGGLLLFYNLLIFLPYATFVPNRGLLEKTEKIADHFSSEDLILVDRRSSGDPHSMLSGPLNFLFGKQAVYFFNPDDLSRINQERFSRIFFIIPDENLDFYAKSAILERLVPVEEYLLEVPVLRNIDEKSRINLPAKETLFVSGGIYEFRKL